jgi:hypothetical protein
VLHLTATIRRRDKPGGDTADPDGGQIDVDADTYDTARQAVLDQLTDGWIVIAYRVDRPAEPS